MGLWAVLVEPCTHQLFQQLVLLRTAGRPHFVHCLRYIQSAGGLSFTHPTKSHLLGCLAHDRSIGNIIGGSATSGQPRTYWRSPQLSGSCLCDWCSLAGFPWARWGLASLTALRPGWRLSFSAVGSSSYPPVPQGSLLT